MPNKHKYSIIIDGDIKCEGYQKDVAVLRYKRFVRASKKYIKGKKSIHEKRIIFLIDGKIHGVYNPKKKNKLQPA